MLKLLKTPVDLAKFEMIVKPLIWASAILYFVELSTGSKDSLSGIPFFIWFERCVATIFTAEIWIRRSEQKRTGKPYHAVFFIIDLIAVIPFWIGFFVPKDWLGMIRTMRILRLLKLFRYKRSLQLAALSFYQAAGNLKVLGLPLLVAFLFGSAVIYQLEHEAQPEKFTTILDSIWFNAVTMTTVGYGDISPVTTAGKLFTIFFVFIVCLAMVGAALGILSSTFSTLIEQERDPNIDPIELFLQAKKEHKERRRVENEFESNANLGENKVP